MGGNSGEGRGKRGEVSDHSGGGGDVGRAGRDRRVMSITRVNQAGEK